MEQIVKRLQEERKFNYLQSEEPGEATDSMHLDSLLDPETRALIGNTDGQNRMSEIGRKKLAVETTREKLENHLSFRSQYNKSHAQVMDLKVEQEMKKALQPEVKSEIVENPVKITNNNTPKGKELKEETRQIRFADNNIDSARTEKYNRYSSRRTLPAMTQSPTAKDDLPKLLDDETTC